MMRRRLLPAASVGVIALLALTAASPRAQAANQPPPLRRDIYGGLTAISARRTGFFRLAVMNGRWSLLSPLGHPLWLRSVYVVDFADGGRTAQAAVARDFHGDPAAFARQAVARLKSWGFNALGGYASTYALPVPAYFRPHGNPDRLPFIRLLNISWYGAIDSGHLAPEPFKTLLAGAVDPRVYHDWMGNVPDVFDPNFAIYARNLAADRATASRQTVFTARTTVGGDPQPSLAQNPWLLATTPDDADDLFGFGPGPERPGPDGAIHPHIGWIVAVTKPEQKENTQVGQVIAGARTVRYSDPTVYAKVAWREMLQHKYGTIAALNSAWGSNYTTFGSDGGWPNGRGLMDESGLHAWIGNDPLRLAHTTPAARADMDAFLALYADRYFRIVTEAIHAATPRQLIFSPVLDSHGGLTRPAILRAAGRYCDALQIDAEPSRPEVIARTYALAGKPMFSWLGLRADSDSALGAPAPGLPAGAVTQAGRGLAYARHVAWLFSFRTAPGVAPIFGLDWWEYMDKLSERANWGLVGADNQPYNASWKRRVDKITPGGSSVGSPTDADDFLSAVTTANFDLDRRFLAALGDPSQTAKKGRH